MLSGVHPRCSQLVTAVTLETLKISNSTNCTSLLSRPNANARVQLGVPSDCWCVIFDRLNDWYAPWKSFSIDFIYRFLPWKTFYSMFHLEWWFSDYAGLVWRYYWSVEHEVDIFLISETESSLTLNFLFIWYLLWFENAWRFVSLYMLEIESVVICNVCTLGNGAMVE